MKPTYICIVPVTREMGTFKTNCSACYMESYKANALWQYNSSREHDNLEPLTKMPAGTTYHKFTK
jgi:hypothetical protein